MFNLFQRGRLVCIETFTGQNYPSCKDIILCSTNWVLCRYPGSGNGRDSDGTQRKVHLKVPVVYVEWILNSRLVREVPSDPKRKSLVVKYQRPPSSGLSSFRTRGTLPLRLGLQDHRVPHDSRSLVVKVGGINRVLLDSWSLPFLDRSWCGRERRSNDSL